MHKNETVTRSDTGTAANTLVTLSSGHPTGHLVTSNTVPLTLGLPNTINTKQPVPTSITSTPRPGSGASGSYDSDTYQLPDGAGSDIKIKDEPDDGSISGGDDDDSLMSPGNSGVSPIDM